MPSSKTLEAKISVNGIPLPEFDVQEETGADGINQVTCWIPSKAGKCFVIEVKDSRDADRPPTAWQLNIDGNPCGDVLILPGDGEYASDFNEVVFAAIETSEGHKAMAFAELKLIDDDEVGSDGYQMDHASLGEVTAVVQHIKLLGDTGEQAEKYDLTPVTLHERSKKIGAHTINLIEPHDDVPIDSSRCMEGHVVGSPLVMFIFRYRPIETLQDNGIVPLPPHPTSPDPLPPPAMPLVPAVPVKADPDGELISINEEIRKLEGRDRELEALRTEFATRQLEIREKISTLKRKRDGQAGVPTAIKTEPEAGPSTNRRRIDTKPGEVVDLTLDDD